MTEKYLLNNIDSLLFHLALQTRELSQQKNELNQQIKAYRADIAEKRSQIETLHRNVKKLEEEIKLKQSSVANSKANVKSMRSTNSLLLQYEQTLRGELESRKAGHSHDMQVYEERITSYRKLFQSHKEYYCQNPLAQKLLQLQAEKEEIEGRIRACDNQIILKQTELDHLTDQAVNSSSSEILPDSVSGQQPTKEPGKQFNPQTEENSDCTVNITSLHLNTQMMVQNGHKVSVEANDGDIHEKHKAQDPTACCPDPEEESEQSWPDGVHTDDQEKERELQEQALDEVTTASEIEEAVEDKVEERAGPNEEQTTCEEETKELIAFSPSPPAKMTTASSTPVFSFNFSPTRSQHQGTSEDPSPAFLFSDPSTSGMSGFGFDMGKSQDEETAFAFTSPFFSQKKTTGLKSSDCVEFMFDQSEESEVFPFAFTSKSPQATNKDKAKEEFPFSFNF